MPHRLARLFRIALIVIGSSLGLLFVVGCLLPLLFDYYLSATPHFNRLRIVGVENHRRCAGAAAATSADWNL